MHTGQKLTLPWQVVADKLEEFMTRTEVAVAADDFGTPETVAEFRVAYSAYDGFILAACWFAETEDEEVLLREFGQREAALNAHVTEYLKVDALALL